MSSIVQASTIDRYIIAKTVLRLIRKRQLTHGELNLSVGKLSPALDDFLVPALRNTIDNLTDFEARRLQGQRECLKDNVAILDLATVAVQADAIRKKSRSIRDFFDRLRRDCPRASGPAQLRRYLALHFPEPIVRHLAAHRRNGATKLSLRWKSSISFLSSQREGFSPRGTGTKTAPRPTR
jgi:hypothetical protein